MLVTRGAIKLEILPERGGGVGGFLFGDIDIFRPVCAGNPSPLALSNFPLVPFSGRIASGQFQAGGETVRLPVTPDVDPVHAIHGHGWYAAWDVIEQSAGNARLRYNHPGGEWPWAYRSEQDFTLTGAGYRHGISVQNLGATPMPAGLGLHPYFPRQGAVIETKFDTRWSLEEDRLPIKPERVAQVYDWFGGALTDHGFGRNNRGAITIAWPSHYLTMTPAADLSHTVIYIPPGEDFFCVEPVSHVANAINMAEYQPNMRWLAAGETWQTWVDFAVTMRT